MRVVCELLASVGHEHTKIIAKIRGILEKAGNLFRDLFLEFCQPNAIS